MNQLRCTSDGNAPLHFEHPAKFKDSSAEQSVLAVKPCSDNRKASLSVAENEALSERVRGIEPPPEAWKNDYQ
jgi:hypothetical protein